jgi:nucleotide-binding universal stress UspA family protein
MREEIRFLALRSTTEAIMKNILLLVHDDDGQEARLQAALDVVRALEGHLTCVDVTPPVVIAGDLLVGFGTGAIISDERQAEARNKAMLIARLREEDVNWNWIDAYGEFADRLLDAAAIADLIVLNKQLHDTSLPHHRDVASDLLIHARTPILAVPPHLRQFNPSGRALIAWDGQASVIATMRACTPILRLASDVHLFMARESGDAADASEAATYLSRHGIHANIHVLENALAPIEQLICEEAALRRADYILMGAYSHGRLVETFGGVTKRMLKNLALPLLLGH